MIVKEQSRLDWRAIMKMCGGTRKAVAPAEPVFRQGEPADGIYYLLKGRIKVTIVSALGKEAVMGLLHQGELLGDDRLRGHECYAATATTLSECDLIRLPTTGVKKALQDDQQFALWLNRYLLKRVEKLEIDIVDHLFNSAEQRLARLLMQLARSEETECGPIAPSIDQQTLARMIGTTRPRVSQFMSEFRKKGYIEYSRGRITVNNSLLNAVLSEPRDIDV